tara:strand:- start:173 stop:877 length:705 start_codon:yes stop_codon:yes gene_type:complete
MKHLEFETFGQAYVGNIRKIYNEYDYDFASRIGDCWERTSHSYEVNDMASYKFENEELGKLDYDYIEKFYDWLISGSTDTEEAFKEYPNVAKFLKKPENSLLPDNFNTFYGPRIVGQREQVVNELKSNPNSRRAVISILKDSDLILLGTDEKLEFPCTDSATFFIRKGKLNCHLHMRSQNMVTVVKLDMYLWARFTCEMAKELGVETGKFTSSIVSAHVFERDQEYLQSLNIID